MVGRRISVRNALLIASIIVAITMLFLYASMLPHEYSDANYGSDAGDLLTAVLTGGVAHPSGYPTYLVLGSIFQKLPLASAFFKGALLSAVFSALATGMLVYIAGKIFLIKGRTLNSMLPIAITVGIAFGISPLFWSQAVIVEVYGLATFFLLCAVLWMLLISNGQISKKDDLCILLLSIMIGLGFGNHLMIGLLIPAMAYASYLYIKNDNSVKRLVKYLIFIMLSAFIIYLVLPIRAKDFPPVNWGNPQTLDGFLWLVSGKPYQGLAFGIPMNEVYSRFLYFLGALRTQFGIIGAFLGIMGTVMLVSSRDRIKPIFVWILLIFLFFSIGYETDDSLVYLTPFFMIFALLIVYGLIELFDLIKVKGWLPRVLICLGFLAPLAIRFPGIFQEIDPRSEQDAKIFAQTCLAELPQNAILITQEDNDTFPIWYFHYGLNERQDIHVIVESLLVYDWYRDTLKHTYPDLELPEKSKNVLDILKGNPTYQACLPIPQTDKGFLSCECNLE